MGKYREYPFLFTPVQDHCQTFSVHIVQLSYYGIHAGKWVEGRARASCNLAQEDVDGDGATFIHPFLLLLLQSPDPLQGPRTNL